MRLSAVIDTAQGLTVHDHVGWAFGHPTEFRTQAGRFLSEGLAARQRIIYVAGAGTAGPGAIDGLDAALVTGQAQITSVPALYTAGETVHPKQQVDTFADAVEQALADGWTGLRVAADVTSLVLSDRQRAAWLRYEHLIDTFLTTHPVSGMCGFDRTALDRFAMAEVTCLHPVVNPDASGFRLYTADGTGCGLTLAGEIDRDSRDVLAAALRHVRPALHRGRLTIDATALSFVDHHGLAVLDDYATARDVRVVLHTEQGSIASRLAHLVPMTGLDVVVSS
jgi:anti-anti-sigma regulatory factor